MSKSTTLPKGTLIFPKLNEPDDYKGKRQYKTRIEFSDEDHRKVDAWLKKIAKDGGVSKLPWVKDKKTGKISLQAKSGEDHPPPFIDAKGNKIPRSKVRVGGGTMARVGVTANVYDGFGGGVNLYIDGVQIIDLKASSRFQVEEEEGFTWDGSDDEDEAEAPTANADMDDDIPF